MSPHPSSTSVAAHVVLFENNITGTTVRKGRKLLDPRSPKKAELGTFTMEFLQFLENGMIIALPPNCCAKGHRVTISVEVSGLELSVELKAVGVVEDMETGIQEFDTVTLRFVSVHPEQWAKVQDLYGKRQTRLAALFSAIKGE